MYAEKQTIQTGAAGVGIIIRIMDSGSTGFFVCYKLIPP